MNNLCLQEYVSTLCCILSYKLEIASHSYTWKNFRLVWKIEFWGVFKTPKLAIICSYSTPWILLAWLEYFSAFTVTNLAKTNKIVPWAKLDINKKDQLVNLWQTYKFLFNVLCKHFITQVSVRSHVCGIATIKSLLQTACVWSHGLDRSSSVCIWRVIMFF